ncbi:MAG: acyl-CoA thioesterase [Isosphaeraceae bacterium]
MVYLRYAQDAAVAHWYAVVDQKHRDSMVWVVRRHEIDYLKPALENDELVARTWVGAPSGATLERFIEIRKIPRRRGAGQRPQRLGGPRCEDATPPASHRATPLVF